MNLDQIEKEVQAGFINCQRHPSAPLRIYNYSAKAQYEWHWTEETMICRGLILDDENRVVSRPFRKFFSYEQLEGKVPVGNFQVFDKLDGSLGVLYWAHGEPYIATRGSFVSEQAKRATAILANKYSHVLPLLDRSLTYLFEIIYPENRIVVNYGGLEDIILLALIETETGKELPLPNIGFNRVERFDGAFDLSTIQTLAVSNREGFVARFDCGTRVKFKFDEYKRLHRLVTGINLRHVWELLSTGQGIEALLDKVPDEFYAWIQDGKTKLETEFNHIEAEAKAEFSPREDRRSTAEYFKTCKHPAILFQMLDGKSYSNAIWKMIRPSGANAFRCDIDQ